MNFQQTGAAVAFLYVTDRERALRFYQDIFGVALRSSDAFGDFLDVSGTLVRMTTMPDYRPSPHPVFGWNVGDIESAAHWLRSRGIEFTIHDGMGQDALGIWTAPDGKVKIAFFADPDGNVLTLSQT